MFLELIENGLVHAAAIDNVCTQSVKPLVLQSPMDDEAPTSAKEGQSVSENISSKLSNIIQVS